MRRVSTATQRHYVPWAWICFVHSPTFLHVPTPPTFAWIVFSHFLLLLFRRIHATLCRCRSVGPPFACFVVIDSRAEKLTLLIQQLATGFAVYWRYFINVNISKLSMVE